MEFKSKPEKGNVVAMVSIMIAMLFICGIWFYIGEKIYGLLFLLLTIITIHIYFFTSYFLENNKLKVKLGFIPISFKYMNIKSVEDLGKKVRISTNNLNIEIYVEDKEKFIKELSKKIK